MIGKMITQSFDEIVNILSKAIMNGDLTVDRMRCIYKTDDSNIIYILTACDFVDLDLKKESIKKIALYQLID